MNAELESVCNRLIAAVVDGGWQGVALVALVAIALKLFRRVNAATRHAVWFVTLLIVAALPFLVLLVPKMMTVPAVEVMPPIPPAPLELASPEEITWESDITLESQPAAPVERWQFSAPRNLALILVASWLGLALIRLIFLARQLAVLRSLKNSAEAAPAHAQEIFDQARKESICRRAPQLLFSGEIAAPIVLGFFRPAVLLPKALMSEGRLIDVFRHELAHVARRDDWANLAQQVIRAIYFFHPAVHFVSRRITNEREIACDDHALAGSGKPREYALLLAEFASRMKGRDFTAAPAAWSSNSQLKERIGMILDGKRNASPRVSRAGAGVLSAAALCVAVGALIAAPRLLTAAETATVEATSSATTEITIDETPEVSVETVVTRTEPPGISVATVTTKPRVDVHITPVAPSITSVASVPAAPAAPAPSAFPAPARIVATHPSDLPSPTPRPKPSPRAERGADELERRLERLERMVESLVGREKGEKEKGDKEKGEKEHGKSSLKFNFDADGKWHEEIERAHRETERAQREMERAQRDAERAIKNFDFDKVHKQAMAAAAQAAKQGEQARQIAADQSIKARRQALEAQRRAIEKQIEALDKEMQKENEANEKQRNKPDEPGPKPEKKRRDTGSEDSEPSKN